MMNNIHLALRQCFKLLRNLLKSMWVFIAAFFSIATMYVLLIGVEQGIDMVIHAGEFPERGMLAVVAIVIWAYLLWYSCRTLSYVKQDRDDRLYSRNYHRYGVGLSNQSHG